MIYGFFPGCAYQTAAGYQESVQAVCEQLGVELKEIEDWNCCGATASFSRNQDQALLLAGRLFALAARSGFGEIITICNACYSTLKKAAKIFKDCGDLLKKVNQGLKAEGLQFEHPQPVRHLLEVIVRDRDKLNWPGGGHRLPDSIKVATYYGCQLTRPWQPIPQALRPELMEDLFSTVGLDTVDHSAKTLCCGASHAVAYADQCHVLVKRIVNEIRAKGGNLIATICPLCQFNLDQGQTGRSADRIPVAYFTQVLGLALGVNPDRLGLEKLLVPFKT